MGCGPSGGTFPTRWRDAAQAERDAARLPHDVTAAHDTTARHHRTTGLRAWAGRYPETVLNAPDFRTPPPNPRTGSTDLIVAGLTGEVLGAGGQTP